MLTRLARGVTGVLKAGVGFGLGIAAGAVLEARVGMRLRRASIAVLPPGAESIRVLHLSDFHMMPSMRLKTRWIRSLADLRPDLIVNTGDNLSSPEAFEFVMQALAPHLGRPGAFVFGSNDYHSPQWRNPLRYLTASRSEKHEDERAVDLPAETLAACLTSAGWLDARNTSGVLTVRGTPLIFLGVDDPHIDRDRMPEPATLSTTSAHGTEGDHPGSSQQPVTPVRIGLTHAPYSRVLQAFDRADVDVVFAGHTHGGQVCVPGYGALVTNCDLPTWRASGLMGWPGAQPSGSVRTPWPPLRRKPKNLESSRMWVHISAGLGTSPFAPIRLFCRPEATLITLTARDVDHA